MEKQSYAFTVGNIRCLAVSDGTMTYGPPNFPPPPIFLCGNAPPEQLATTLGMPGSDLQKWTEWTSSYTCLLINTGKYKVLVDTGANGLAETTGRLIQNLHDAGITPEDIDLVILSHGHPDHIGGNIDSQGNPVFPKARWVMRSEEWHFWTSSQAEQRLPEHGRDILTGIARKNLLPLEHNITLLDTDSEIIPGIKAIAAPGHTPGQVALEIASQEKRLMYISDVVIHPLHLAHPEWCAATDVLPVDLVATRRKFLPLLAAEKTMVMAFHFPFPGLGYIAPQEEAWRWQPI